MADFDQSIRVDSDGDSIAIYPSEQDLHIILLLERNQYECYSIVSGPMSPGDWWLLRDKTKDYISNKDLTILLNKGDYQGFFDLYVDTLLDVFIRYYS